MARAIPIIMENANETGTGLELAFRDEKRLTFDSKYFSTNYFRFSGNVSIIGQLITACKEPLFSQIMDNSGEGAECTVV